MKTLTQISKNIQNVLEDDSSSNDFPFEESKQYSLLSGASLCLPEDDLEKLAILLSRIQTLYSASFLFEQSRPSTQTNWKLVMGYKKNQILNIDWALKSFPQQKIDEVLRTSTKKFFQGSEAPNKLLDLTETTCLLYAPTSAFRFVFLTQKTDPWLKDFSEATLRVILDGIAG